MIKENSALKNLIYYSNSLQELEEDEEEIERTIENAEFISDTIEILDNIGEDGFKFIYDNTIQNISLHSIDKQIDFCYNIINKITEVYDFIFIKKIEISEEDINSIYELLKFIEYDNINFLSDLLKDYSFDIENSKDFINKKWNEIHRKILDIEYSGFVSDFLKTNTKENIVNFIHENLQKNKTEFIIKKEGRF